MSTLLRIAINHGNREDILSEIKNIYLVGEIKVKNSLNKDEFFVPDYAYRTLVLHQEVSANWVQIYIELSNLYELDELLRQMTRKFSTLAFIGYNQTTSGDFRFAYFEKGELKRSILLQYIDCQNQVRIMDNFGKKLPFETFDFGTPFTRKLPDDQLLNYEVLNDWYRELGFICQDRDNVDYLHLEIKNFKN